MSAIESEFGSMTFSKKEFSAFSKKMIDCHNARQSFLHELATYLHGQIVESAKGVRNFNKYEKLMSYFNDFNYLDFINLPIIASQPKFSGAIVSGEEVMLILKSIFSGDQIECGLFFPPENQPKKVSAPKKKDFPTAKMNKQANISFDVGSYGAITLLGSMNELRWASGKGYRVIDEVYKSPMVRAMMAELKLVNWVGNTGGVIYRTDQDDHEGDEGFFNKSVYLCFGQKGKKIKELEAQLRRLQY